MDESPPDPTLTGLHAARADVRGVLARAAGASLAEVVELLCADQAERWRSGERVPAETYVQLHPGLGDDPAAFELVYSEYLLREQLGEAPTLEEYQLRFPHFSDRLYRQIGLHRALLPEDPAPSAAVAPGDTLQPGWLREFGAGPEDDPGPPNDQWVVLPGYEILGVLGAGGMGVVYKARQLNLKRLVALKVIRAAACADPDDLRRFRAEAETVGRLQHPNIVQIHEVGEHQGTAFLTLEYVPGGSLRERLAGAPLRPAEAARLAAVLARASQFAHEHGVVHRDLKPANVLFAADGSPKIADFGLAKQLEGDSAQTRTGEILGTPSYMAPEQARGRTHDVTAAADVYALGAVLYECLTGRPPFKGATVLSTLEQVATLDPLPPGRLQRNTPRDLETICLKCLEKEPRKRYPTAAALADDVERFLEGKPIRARPTPAWERLWKAVRRRPTAAALAAAVVFVAALGFVLVTWQWLRADGEWRRAETKAAGERTAKEAAQAAEKRLEQEQARLALGQGLALCEQGEIDRGLLWMERGLELADKGGAADLDRPIRVNLADWSRQLSRPSVTVRHPISCNAVAFSPDGRTLLSAGNDGYVHLWDAELGREDGAPLSHLGPAWTPRTVFTAAYSPDGTKILTSASDGKVHLWGAISRKQLAPAPDLPNDADVWRVAFSSDGKMIATAGGDGVARLWDAATGRSIGVPMRHGDREMFRLAFGPGDRTLLTGSRDNLVKRWSVPDGAPLEPPLQHTDRPTLIAVSPDGRLILTGAGDGSVHIWDGASLERTDLPTQQAAVCAGAFSADGKRFAVGTDGGVVRLWDAASLRPVGQAFPHNDRISSVAFSPDGGSLAIAEGNGTIQVWGTPAPQWLGEPLYRDSPVSAVAYDHTGERLLTCDQGRGRVWEPGSHRATTVLFTGRLMLGASLAPDGRTATTAQWDGFGCLWDAGTGELLLQTPKQSASVNVAVYSPDGGSLLTVSNRPSPDFFPRERGWLTDVARRQPLRPVLRGLDVDVTQAAFAPDGRSLLLACRDGKARFWDLEKDQEIGAPLEHAAAVTAVAYGPDGRRVLTGCRDGTARLWDADERRPLLEPLRHQGEIHAVAFSPDGATLLTGGLDGAARFWEAASGQPLGPPLRHAAGILSVAYHPDGARVLTGSIDRTARRWRVPPMPVPGEPQRLRLWVETLTGLELDDQGAIHGLDAGALERRRRSLQDLGGPPLP